MRSPRGDRRVLCTLRDALPVWDVGKGGLRVDCEIVRSRAPPLLAYVSQGSEGPQGGLSYPCAHRRIISSLSRPDDLPATFYCEARAHKEARVGGPHISRSISHAGSRCSNLGYSHHRWQQALGGLDSGSSSSPIPSYDCWDPVPMPRYTNSCTAACAAKRGPRIQFPD
jgi:hypothetical protein